MSPGNLPSRGMDRCKQPDNADPNDDQHRRRLSNHPACWVISSCLAFFFGIAFCFCTFFCGLANFVAGLRDVCCRLLTITISSIAILSRLQQDRMGKAATNHVSIGCFPTCRSGGRPDKHDQRSRGRIGEDNFGETNANLTPTILCGPSLPDFRWRKPRSSPMIKRPRRCESSHTTYLFAPVDPTRKVGV